MKWIGKGLFVVLLLIGLAGCSEKKIDKPKNEKKQEENQPARLEYDSMQTEEPVMESDLKNMGALQRKDTTALAVTKKAFNREYTKNLRGISILSYSNPNQYYLLATEEDSGDYGIYRCTSKECKRIYHFRAAYFKEIYEEDQAFLVMYPSEKDGEEVTIVERISKKDGSVMNYILSDRPIDICSSGDTVFVNHFDDRDGKCKSMLTCLDIRTMKVKDEITDDFTLHRENEIYDGTIFFSIDAWKENEVIMNQVSFQYEYFSRDFSGDSEIYAYSPDTKEKKYMFKYPYKLTTICGSSQMGAFAEYRMEDIQEGVPDGSVYWKDGEQYIRYMIPDFNFCNLMTAYPIDSNRILVQSVNQGLFLCDRSQETYEYLDGEGIGKLYSIDANHYVSLYEEEVADENQVDYEYQLLEITIP